MGSGKLYTPLYGCGSGWCRDLLGLVLSSVRVSLVISQKYVNSLYPVKLHTTIAHIYTEQCRPSLK